MNTSRAPDKMGMESVCWMGRFWAAKYSIGNATMKELYQSFTFPYCFHAAAGKNCPPLGRLS